jgi:toxin ParE1/3/4
LTSTIFFVPGFASARAKLSPRHYVERIRARGRLIPALLHAGRPRDDLAPGLRTVPFERRAVIVYRIAVEALEITNMFHGGRDYAALYRPGGTDPGT